MISICQHQDGNLSYVISLYLTISYHLKKWDEKYTLVQKGRKKKCRKWNKQNRCMSGIAILYMTTNLIWSQLLVCSVKIMRIYFNLLYLIKNYPFSMTSFLNIVSSLTFTFLLFLFLSSLNLSWYGKMLNWNYCTFLIPTWV